MDEPRAWKVSVIGWRDRDAGIYGATTRAKATSRALAQATDAGYALAWNSLRTVRAPEYDCLVARFGLLNGWDKWHADETLKREKGDSGCHGKGAA